MSYLSIASYDIYSNQLSFPNIPDINVKILAEGCTLAHVNKMKMALSSDKRFVEIMDILVESKKLNMIRPHYEAVLEISLKNKSFSQSAPCKVLPGHLHSVTLLGSFKFRKSVSPGYVMEGLLFEACDIYGNHVEEGLEVYVEVEGLCFLDRQGPNRKVGSQGYIDLNLILKVEASYGTTVQLAIHYDGKTIFEKQFPVEKRDMRVVSNVPTSCVTGSLLENIIFEVFDPNGLVDESIHGPHHMLMIASDSNMDSTVQYSFCRGRCTVPFIRVPQEKGIFHFSASHTHHRELCTSVKVYVVEGPELELVCAEDPVVDIVPSHFSDNGSFLQDSSYQNPIDLHLMDCVIHLAKKLDEEVVETAEVVWKHEGRLKELRDQSALLAKYIDELQEPCILRQYDCLSKTKQQIVKCIETKNVSAAVFCSLSKTIQFQEPEVNLTEELVGIVALLATVDDDRLSRVLAEYLTESYMIAVVFKSYKTAPSLETYTKDGKVNGNCAIHKIVSQFGTKVDKRFTAIFLDEIRPYLDVLEGSGHERKLALQFPCLSSGKSPHGFLGYAVNMINLDIRHSHIKSSSGYGLRETLFYRLFGEMQVYETWEDIEHAKGCIKSGAVSLDGRIMRESGIICLGDCDPDVKFPVLQTSPSPHTMKVWKQIDEKKAEMARIEECLCKESAAHSRAVRKFNKRRQRLADFMQDQKLANLEHQPL